MDEWDTKILAVIPARGGSKGIKGKNIKMLNGFPLIHYTIVSAISSGVFYKVVVSTDDLAIADISKSIGAEVPFLRAGNLAQDASSSIDVAKDALIRCEEIFKTDFDAVCLLQPTTPLRSRDDYCSVIDLFKQDVTLDSVISVTEVSEHPYKMCRSDKFGVYQPFLDWPIENPARQMLPQFFVYNGAFYLTKKQTLLEKSTFRGDNCKLYRMPKERSVNIDDIVDFYLAERLIGDIEEFFL